MRIVIIYSKYLTECNTHQPLFYQVILRKLQMAIDYLQTVWYFYFYNTPPTRRYSPIWNTPERTHFCPSKTIFTALFFTTAIKFQTGWNIFVLERKREKWASYGQKHDVVGEEGREREGKVYRSLILSITHHGIVKMINSSASQNTPIPF